MEREVVSRRPRTETCCAERPFRHCTWTFSACHDKLLVSDVLEDSAQRTVDGDGKMVKCGEGRGFHHKICHVITMPSRPARPHLRLKMMPPCLAHRELTTTPSTPHTIRQNGMLSAPATAHSTAANCILGARSNRRQEAKEEVVEGQGYATIH